MTPKQFETHMAVQTAILEELKAVRQILRDQDSMESHTASRLINLDRSLKEQTFPSVEVL